MLFVLLCGLSVFPAVSGDCNGVCWFLFDNRNGDKDSSNVMWTKSDTKQPTGLVTIGGTFLADSKEAADTLRFQNYGTTKAIFEPLIFQHEFSDSGNKLNIYGSKNGISTPNYEQTISGIANTGNFEIKFTSLNSDKIFIQYSDANKKDTPVIFTYNDNWSSWGPLSGTPYFETNRIFSQLRRTKYRYIHLCQVERPTMCDANLKPETQLGKELTIACSAVGPATLKVEWTASKSSEAISTTLKTKNDATKDLGSVIESTLTISKFTLDHIASYTCKVTGSNSLDATQIFTLDYTSEIKVNPISEQNYYLAATQDASFTFQVTGWPLADVSIRTHYDKKEGEDGKTKNGVTDNGTENGNGVTSNEADDSKKEGEDLFILVRTNEYSAVPPRVTFKVLFKKQIPGDMFTFYFIDNAGGKNKTVRTYNIYKVGATCKAGEYGVGTECKACGADETSPAKSDGKSDCVKATSNCKAGFYGVDDDCKKCPDGKTSKDKALNLNNCFVDPNANAEKNTGDDKDGSNLSVIIGGAIGGVILLLVLLAVLYYFLCYKKGHVYREKSDVEMSKRAEPRKIEAGGTVTVNRSAEDLENSKKIEENSEDEDPHDLYDNRNLQSFRNKKRKQKAKQNNSSASFDQHLDDIDSGIKALDDIQIENEEPAYAELDKEHYQKVKEEKAEKRRTQGFPSERRNDQPKEPQEHTYAEAQDIESKRQATSEKSGNTQAAAVSYQNTQDN